MATKSFKDYMDEMTAKVKEKIAQQAAQAAAQENAEGNDEHTEVRSIHEILQEKIAQIKRAREQQQAEE